MPATPPPPTAGAALDEGSAQAPCGDKSEACLTPEQQAVVETNVRAGEILKVVAFAGTGKTTCLREWAARRPHLRILYAAVSKPTTLPRTVVKSPGSSLCTSDNAFDLSTEPLLPG